MKITPENITELKPGEVFVFGSNLSGIHGKGAAALAAKKFGARRGIGWGLSGRSYAIPTRGTWNRAKKTFDPMDIEVIGEWIWDFLTFAIAHQELEFLVTKIGCGYAGFTVTEIARLFTLFGPIPPNVSLPKEFWGYALYERRS